MPGNRRLGADKCQAVGSEITLKTPPNGSKWQAVGSQMAVKRRLGAGKCQAVGKHIALKTPPNGSQMAGNRRLGGCK